MTTKKPSAMRVFFDSVGGRKFALAVMVIVSANVLCWYAAISGEAWATVMISTAGAYIAGNVVAAIKGVSE